MTSYRPAAFYHRRRIRTSKSLGQAKEAGLAVVAELEDLRAWIRAQGLVPPKVMSEDEARDILACPATDWQREIVRKPAVHRPQEPTL